MKLTITDQAKEHLAQYLNEKNDLLLDFDDGIGPLSLEGTCQFDVTFRLIVTKKGNYQDTYDKSFKDNGIHLRYKGYSETYMDQQMKLDWNERLASFDLSGDSGVLTAAMAIISDTI